MIPAYCCFISLHPPVLMKRDDARKERKKPKNKVPIGCSHGVEWHVVAAHCDPSWIRPSHTKIQQSLRRSTCFFFFFRESVRLRYIFLKSFIQGELRKFIFRRPIVVYLRKVDYSNGRLPDSCSRDPKAKRSLFYLSKDVTVRYIK